MTSEVTSNSQPLDDCDQWLTVGLWDSMVLVLSSVSKNRKAMWSKFGSARSRFQIREISQRREKYVLLVLALLHCCHQKRAEPEGKVLNYYTKGMGSQIQGAEMAFLGE